MTQQIWVGHYVNSNGEGFHDIFIASSEEEAHTTYEKRFKGWLGGLARTPFPPYDVFPIYPTCLMDGEDNQFDFTLKMIPLPRRRPQPRTNADIAGDIHNLLSKVRDEAEELGGRVEAVREDVETVEDSPLDEECYKAIVLLNGMHFLYQDGEALEDAVQKITELMQNDLA